MAKLNMHFSTRKAKSKGVHQSQPLPGMTLNNAGGFGFEVDDWIKLRRFLVLGSEGGTYYVGEAKLTIENAQAVHRLLLAEPLKVVAELVEISQSGRSAKNNACLFALAMVAALANVEGRRAALAALPLVARTGTHLFTFVDYVQSFRGWGRALRRAVSLWYEDMPLENLAVQLAKYPNRDGWSHRDLMRLTHAKAADPARNALFRFAVKGTTDGVDDKTLLGCAQLQSLGSSSKPDAVAEIVSKAHLSIEMVPAQLRSKEVYRILAKQAGLEWLLRNLGNLAKHELLRPAEPKLLNVVNGRLTDEKALKRARLHPLKILAALVVYRKGSGVRGSGSWTPDGSVIDALDQAFYQSFQSVSATGSRLCLGLDVSGSMASTSVNGIAGLTAREACGAMALATARVEKNAHFIAFDTEAYPLTITARQRLDDVTALLSRTGGGGTDCAMPIRFAQKKKIPVDVFIIYTDSETWAGMNHPVEALDNYREAMGIDARLVTVAMAASRISLADCKDSRMLNVVGFDTATPEIISQFVRGEL